jgi:hypothetical protein
MPAFLACVRGTHGRGEGANVGEGARTAEVWAQIAEGGGGYTVQRRAHMAWGACTAGGVYGRRHVRQGACMAPGSGAGRGVWGVCFFIISFGFFFA